MALKWRACCSVCYSCYLTPPVSKKEAERAATSHLNVYRHDVTVQTVERPVRIVTKNGAHLVVYQDRRPGQRHLAAQFATDVKTEAEVRAWIEAQPELKEDR